MEIVIVKQLRGLLAAAAGGDLGARLALAMTVEELMPLLLNVVDAAVRKQVAITDGFTAIANGDSKKMWAAHERLKALDLPYALDVLRERRIDGIAVVSAKGKKRGGKR